MLGISLYRTVAARAVILLLATVSDYNLLLISRLTQKAGAGLATGIRWTRTAKVISPTEAAC
nr:MMPL family transporter [Mycobacterium simulans]